MSLYRDIIFRQKILNTTQTPQINKLLWRDCKIQCQYTKVSNHPMDQLGQGKSEMENAILHAVAALRTEAIGGNTTKHAGNLKGKNNKTQMKEKGLHKQRVNKFQQVTFFKATN